MPPEDKTKKFKPNNKAAIVWLVIFIVIGILLIFKNFDKSKVTEWNQSQFIEAIKHEQIITAVIDAQNNDVLTIKGKYILNKQNNLPADVQKDNIKNTTNELLYKTRVQKTAEIDSLLMQIKTVSVNDNSEGWGTLLGSFLPFLIVFIIIYFIISRQIKGANKGAFDFGKSKARMIPPGELKVKFSDIAGADEAKEEIQEVVEFLKDPLKFQLVGGKIPKGCLLVGEPGTGKTLLAKAVASEAGVPFFAISGSDFVEMFVGVGASRVRDMFEQARKHMPCLIFIDEIDAVGRSRFSGMGGGHDEREQTLNAMLVEMDGLESRTGVIVLAATNRPDVLDPALLRPGRFDRQVVMDLPDIKGRRQILDIHARNIKLGANIDLDIVARTTPGFSGADLANLCNEAALLAARENREEVTQKDLEEARDKVSYGRERKSRKITERERVLTAYHEAGHTLVALHMEHSTPIHKVTIIPRGQSYLGATFTMPKEDVYTRSKLELLADMAMAMGGRVAEELKFGDITTGASADIEHTTRIARQMVCAYGMTEEIGPVRYGEFRNHPHARVDAPLPDSLGEETAREIDLQIRKFVKEALDTARKILSENYNELEILSQELLKKETLDISEINVLLGRTPAEEVIAANNEAEVIDNVAETNITIVNEDINGETSENNIE